MRHRGKPPRADAPTPALRGLRPNAMRWLLASAWRRVLRPPARAGAPKYRTAAKPPALRCSPLLHAGLEQPLLGIRKRKIIGTQPQCSGSADMGSISDLAPEKRTP